MLKLSQNKAKLAVVCVLLLVAGRLTYRAVQKRRDAQQARAVQKQLNAIEKTLEPELEYSLTMPRNSTLSAVLSAQGFSGVDIQKVVQAAKPYKDLARINAGIGYNIDREPMNLANADAGYVNSRVLGLRFKYSPFEHLILQKQLDGEWRARWQVDKVETRLVTYGGKVESSLWDSASTAEMDPNLIVSMAEIFAWQVDFSREVKSGDRWRLSVEERLVRGKNVGWGRIMAAEYDNDGRAFSAVLHQQDGKDLGYFGADGSSLRRMFLRSPLKFGRVTSGFSRSRFHPILKIRRPHMGVDYGAPIGTPIMAVGDGRVTAAGRQGGSGNTVVIRHNGTYTTKYRHMNGFAKGIRNGASVHQGQIIGYVGQTGLATGPHLHYEFWVNNNYTDPLSVKFPSADPITKEQMQGFLAHSAILMRTLPEWNALDVHGTGPQLVAQDLTRQVMLNFAPAASRE